MRKVHQAATHRTCKKSVSEQQKERKRQHWALTLLETLSTLTVVRYNKDPQATRSCTINLKTNRLPY